MVQTVAVVKLLVLRELIFVGRADNYDNHALQQAVYPNLS